jgi:hypothetical protein
MELFDNYISDYESVWLCTEFEEFSKMKIKAPVEYKKFLKGEKALLRAVYSKVPEKRIIKVLDNYCKGDVNSELRFVKEYTPNKPHIRNFYLYYFSPMSKS